MKKLVFAGVVALWTLLVIGCSDPSNPPLFPEEEISEAMELKLSGWKVDSLDKEKLLIRVSPTKGWLDSLVIDSLSLPGSSALYLAADDDLKDPDLGEKLVPGTVVSTADTNQVSIVALDSYNRVVGVWLVVWDLPKKDTSSSVVGNSSASTGTSSSGTAETSESGSSVGGEGSSVSEGGSSAGAAGSSASEGNSANSGNSSATGTESANSSTDSGSSVNSNSSSSEGVSGVKLADLSVSSGTVTVTGTKVYVEVPYGTDLSAITLSPLNGAKDLRRPVEMQFLDEENNLGTYSVVAGVQLPGSDFGARNDFWATTSDAMATEGRATVAYVTNYRFKAEENLSENGESLSLSSKIVTCGWGVSNAIIDGSWKLAGGFYFVGAYSGSDAKNIYDVDYSSGTPSTDESNIAKDMVFGKPFTARPTAFTVKYSYTHEANSSSGYPQKSLVYVMLVGEGGKVVATGAFSDDASTDMIEREVTLSYGADPFGLLSGDYAVAEGLTLGSGNEDVTTIHVMFASSAYAHVVAGGTAGNSGKYRGGENSSLTLDDFKLIY
jgi:hypothetical protein